MPICFTVVEVLPYTLRAKGMALFWLLTGATGAFNTYVNPLGIAAFGWKFYFFYVVWIVVEFVVVYLFFIEVSLDVFAFVALEDRNAANRNYPGQTKGPSLEQIALLFDGKDAIVGKINPVAEEFLHSKEAEIETTTEQQVEEKRAQ